MQAGAFMGGEHDHPRVVLAQLVSERQRLVA